MDEEIVEHQRSESALKASEESMGLLIESSPIGVRVARDGKYVYVNPAFVSMFGYDGPSDLIGLEVEDLYAPEEKERIRQHARDRLAGKPVPPRYEAKVLRKNGESFDADIWLTMIAYDGKPCVLGFVADVSEAKSLRNQLIQSQKMEAIGTLAGGIAHDFNNLLTVILEYSELIISGKDKKDRDYEDLSKVIHAARSAAEMTRQILALSRKTETKLRPVSLNQQVEQLRKMLSRLIPKTIEININLDPDLPVVNADPAQIEQVPMNLAVNSRDAMPNGGTFTVESKRILLDHDYCRSHVEASEGPHVLLIVGDTGTGIDKASMDRIFEPFYTTKKPAWVLQWSTAS